MSELSAPMEILNRIKEKMSWPLMLLWAAYCLHGIGIVVVTGALDVFWFVFSISLMIMFCGLLFVYTRSHWARILFYFIFPASTYCFYKTAGMIIDFYDVKDYDALIASIDTMLLGWAFPDGQITLWLNTEGWARDLFGPHTFFGKILVEFFQSFYFSYYLLGNILFLFLVWKAAKYRQYQNMEFYLVGWFFAYFGTMVFYPLIPVFGPIVYYAHEYKEPLSGFGLAGYIREWILDQQVTKQDCFPSGHTAVSWVVALCALRVWPRFGRFAFFAAICITIATVFLRYHYVTDLIAAIPVVMVCMFLARKALSNCKA